MHTRTHCADLIVAIVGFKNVGQRALKSCQMADYSQPSSAGGVHAFVCVCVPLRADRKWW